MGIITSWLFSSFVVERLTEGFLKLFPIIDKKKIAEVNIPLLIALIFSLVISFGAGFNLFTIFDIDFHFKYAGEFFSAILMSGGSKVIHDIIGYIEKLKKE